MKRLFYLSGALFFLSLTLLVGVHIGQQTATAEPPTQKIVGYSSAGSGHFLILSNGDLYYRRMASGGLASSGPSLVGNFWD